MTRRNKIYNTIGRITTTMGLLSLLVIFILAIIGALEIIITTCAINSSIAMLSSFIMVIIIITALALMYVTINAIITVLTGINEKIK